MYGKHPVRDVLAAAPRETADGQRSGGHWALATRTKSTWPRRTKRVEVVTKV